VSDKADPDYKRQLMPLLSNGYPAYGTPWQPDDTTLVLWCDQHFGQIREANKGQYQVLFWDGSVRRVNGSLFRSGSPVPAAWRVMPADDNTPT
jgi:prepilin-type processing-associated H-X9-DG protein